MQKHSGDHTFKKVERLTGKIPIQELFTRGESFLVYPFRVSYQLIESDQSYPVKILIGVKKKTHRRAVKRNLIKRRSREAYRKQKTELYDFLSHKNLQINLGLIYVSPDILDYTIIDRAIEKIITKLKLKLEVKN